MSGTEGILRELFVRYARFGDPTNPGITITLTQIDKWLKQAGIIDGKRITISDTLMCFQKLKSKSLDFQKFKIFLEILAERRRVNSMYLEELLIYAGSPAPKNVTEAANLDHVYRLTDPNALTGVHKFRHFCEYGGKISGQNYFYDFHRAINGEKRQHPPWMSKLRRQFENFAQMDGSGDGRTIGTPQIVKWLRKAGIMDGKRITVMDISMFFSKLKKNALNFEKFLEFMNQLTEKKMNLEKWQQLLAFCSPDDFSNKNRLHAAQGTSCLRSRITKETKIFKAAKEQVIKGKVIDKKKTVL